MRWLRRSPDRLREQALARAPAGRLRDYLGVPFPSPGTDAADLRLLAVDLETTGMDPRRDRLLSVGFVPVDGSCVDLSGARHLVVRAGGEVGQSAVVHGLTDDDVAAGAPLGQVLETLLDALTGRVLLAHFARIEEGFLAAACQDTWGVGVPTVSVDTLEVARRLLTNTYLPEPPAGSLRLWAARERYGLPTYRAHEALTDALACAELYLAQVAELAATGPVTLRRLRR